MNREEFRHLMNRAGFGATVAQLKSCEVKSRREVVDNLFSSSADPRDITVVKRLEIDDILKDIKESEGDAKKMLKKMVVDRGRDLNVQWLRKMITGNEQLNEKMTFFWHGHFACRDDNPYLLQLLNNAMRTNALGKFKNLLMAVAQAPAMLQFLNNQQNKKSAPNENFARELMELFTLGRGNYTEHDIKEAARAFTGWSFDKETLDFYFRQMQHDYDDKEFFGKPGNFDDADIIDMILYKEECAKFIAGKIYTFFVNDVRDEAIIDSLAQKLYMNDYDIGGLMREIFMSDWFYDKKNIGAKIKSPVELIAGAARHLQVEFSNDDALVFIQKILGQVLFMPPNVAGWPGGKRWIDNSSLIFRMDLGRKIIESSDLTERLKADDDNDPNMAMRKEAMKGAKLSAIDAMVNWNQLVPLFDSAHTDEELFNETRDFLLSVHNAGFEGVKPKMQNKSNDDKLKTAVTWLMSKPEYQLC